MPRVQRLIVPDAMIHIMARGIDGKNIFEHDEDKSKFLRRFLHQRQETGFLCYAWCMMDNHCHFFLRSNEQPLSKLMRPLNGGYAKWFNKKHNRNGEVGR